MYSAEAPEAIRGPAFDTAWCDELAKWKNNQQRTWDNLEFTMRQSENPQIAISTTPRPTKTYKKIVADPKTIRYTGLSTLDNKKHLSKRYIDKLNRKYANTRLGRQEIGGELLSDTPGALWTYDIIGRPVVQDSNGEAVPAHGQYPGMPWQVQPVRVVLAVDPAGRLQDMQKFVDGVEVLEESDGDEAGIVAACLGSDGRYYVISDLTCNGSPLVWGNVTASAYERYKGDRVVGEDNHGGKTVEEVLRRINPRISYEAVHASRGKVPRAEPIAALYEQGLVTHLQEFGALEEEMCSYIPGMPSPNRMDALVFCLTELSENSGAVEEEEDPFGEMDERF
jgi:phage terminase large subunit-like protein